MRGLVLVTLLAAFVSPSFAAFSKREKQAAVIGVSAGALFSKPVRGAVKKVGKSAFKTVKVVARSAK